MSFDNSENIKNAAVKSVFWTAIDSLGSQGITFLVGLVLARLLSPVEFGTIGVAMVFIALFNKIVDCGFSSALIRKQNVRSIDYNTTFIFNILLSFVLYVICWLCSPYIAIFFNNVQLVDVLRWLSLVLIINAFAIIQRTLFVKDINFKIQAKISIVASLVSGGVAIVMVFFKCGVWSLVCQQLTRQCVNSILLWCYGRWRPQIEFSMQIFKEHFSFGGKLLLSGVIDVFCTESVTFVIGKIYSPDTLGQYSRAKQFSGIFSSNLSSVFERATYPVLSRFQDDKEQFLYYYKKLVRSLMLISGIGLMLLAGSAESIIRVLIGDKWIPAIGYLQVVCFNDLFYPIRIVNMNVLSVFGRSDYVLRVTILKRVIQAFPILLGFYNLYFMLWGLVVCGIINFLLNAYYCSKCINYSMFRQILDLLPSIVVSLLLGGVVYIMGTFFTNIYFQLVIQILVGVMMIVFIFKFIPMKEFQFILNIIRPFYKSITK